MKTTSSIILSQRDSANTDRHKNETPVWRAFYVKSRHEKAIRDRFIDADFEVFCPTVTEKKRWADRWKKVERPVIPGYILAFVTEKERLLLLNDPAVLNTVRYLGKPAIVRSEEVELMKTYLDKAVDVQSEPIKPGQRIQISQGSLAGKIGEVEHIAGKEVFIRLESLQLQLRIKIAVEDIEKIKDSE